mmetsp:Transcript_32733/g.93068  ORF Transcript_32733/g.93068 Transcript_32733/m.93068 type:complete len:294 (-) Transcript_32733:94-975(-)
MPVVRRRQDVLHGLVAPGREVGHAAPADVALLRRDLDDVPIPQRQAHNVEAELGHAHEVGALHGGVQEVRHPPGRVRGRPDVAEADVDDVRAGDLRGPHDALEEHLGARQVKVPLGDEAAAVVDAPHLVLGAYSRLPLASCAGAGLAPNAADHSLPEWVLALHGAHDDLVVLHRQLHPVVDHVVAFGEDGEADHLAAVDIDVPIPAACHLSIVAKPLFAERATHRGVPLEPPAPWLHEAALHVICGASELRIGLPYEAAERAQQQRPDPRPPDRTSRPTTAERSWDAACRCGR